MKRLVVGILAHVDSGKTTLSEAMLYTAGAISKLGRVDHQDAFLDTNEIERERGITIFSHQAQLSVGDCEITLLDTPGHVDFSAETERALQVLDYAILVISGSDRVQSHTETLWKLLEHYSIPTFLFINKMDLISSDRSAILPDLHVRLSDSCIDFTNPDEEFYENAAMTDPELLEEYMDAGTLSEDSIADAVASRRIFPCFFGSALKTEGVREFLQGLAQYTRMPGYGSEFGARVFKISEDDRGQRLTYMKITGGSLKVKEQLRGSGWEQKANELRIYSGAKYTSVSEVKAGGICAVCGLSKTFAGEGLGIEREAVQPVIEPILTYSVRLPDNIDLNTALNTFRKLAAEDPRMHVTLNEHLQKLDVQLMGEVQMEVLKRILADRFGMEVGFEHGSIIYKETIENTVEGVGHYEPLRHYAEVHLLMEPGEPGSGIVIGTKCSEDVLDRNWQRLILTHLSEKNHLGVLTGVPVTDIKITLINGRAHQKHTEGGDFRQATYRAVRQGLMQARNVLLEPWNSFTLEIPMENTGRAMTDLQQMGADFDTPETIGELTRIRGSAPVLAMQDYHHSVTAYTRGRGRLFCAFSGYKPCRNADEIIAQIGYDCESDLENTADSVFCSHGSGFVVKWDKVYDYMHLPLYSEPKRSAAPAQERRAGSILASDDELLKIFEQTYGKVERKDPRPMRTPQKEKPFKAKPLPTGPEYLLIDGYNIIFAWDNLKKIADVSLDDARQALIECVCSYRAMRRNNVIIVFDAYKVKGMQREVEQIHGISVVYTREAETADAYIEKTTKQLCKDYRVRVATSDNLEQMIIFGHGARRVTAREFYDEVTIAQEQIREFIRENNIRPEDVYDVIEISEK